MSRRLRDYDEDYVGGLTIGGILARIVGTLVVLTVVFGIMGLVLGWFNAGAKVVSPDNVRQQWQFAYDYDASLKAIATQDCTAKKVADAETNPDIKAQRISQQVAIENNYARVKAEYDGRLRDAFRAKLVKPADVPNQAPTLEQNLAEVCPTK